MSSTSAQTIGAPPALMPDIFLRNRDAACAKLNEVFSGTVLQLQLGTHFPDQVVDLVSAYVANMEDEARIDAVGRCLITASTEAWNAITALPVRHILVADFDLGETNAAGPRLLEKARRAGHAVIYGVARRYTPPESRPKSKELSD
jgi:hypothetical protein